MQRIKEALTGHSDSAKEEGPYDNSFGARHEHHHEQNISSKSQMGEVVSERPVAVGVAEVPVVVTEQERVSTHEHTGVRQAEVEVCGQKAFTELEDRPVVRERVERIVEHRPVEKQYVVETRFVGERELGTGHAEIVDVKERIVEVAQPGPTCPANTGAIVEEVINAATRRV